MCLGRIVDGDQIAGHRRREFDVKLQADDPVTVQVTLMVARLAAGQGQGAIGNGESVAMPVQEVQRCRPVAKLGMTRGAAADLDGNPATLKLS